MRIRTEKQKRAHAEQMRVWRATNLETARVRSKVASAKWRATHPGKVRYWLDLWAKAHPGRRAQWCANRRARVLGAEGSHTFGEWRALLEDSGYACSYCGCTDKPLARDHVIPISRGGSNYISNIVPACKPCNSSKGTG